MIIKNEPYYQTKLGAAYLGNSLELMANIPDESIDLICTSPPFALVRKKEYGNVDADQYVEWFKDFAIHFHRILKPTGSLVIDIGGSWIKGKPVRSLYHFELVIALCKAQKKGGLGFYLAQELYWYNPAKLPTPAEWVTVRRERVKDADKKARRVFSKKELDVSDEELNEIETEENFNHVNTELG